jgi:RND family efflux transporter MFP subunit
MKRIVIITLIVVLIVGGCSALLLMNRQRIEEKAKLDGNLQAIPVYVERLEKSVMGSDFEVSGSFLPYRELNLMSEGQGKVVSLMVNVGENVNSGQLLVKLDDELLVSQLSLANAALDKARADLAKYEGLLKADAISGQQVEDIRLALKKAETDVATLKKQLDYASIRAPFRGTVTKRWVEPGSLLMPGSPVVEIVDISRLKFIAQVAESEAVSIRQGDMVTVSATLFPGVIYKARVMSVGVKSDEARRFPVELELNNDPEHPLKAGMFGSAAFGSRAPRQTLLISRNAIVGSIKMPRVYVVIEGKAELRDIRIGAANDHQVEVLDGLKKGDMVVTSGQINLDQHVNVRIINQKQD